MQENDTTLHPPEQTDGTEKRRHDARWEAAFLAQLTHELGERVKAYAKRRACYVEAKAGIRDPAIALDLYHDAITDTWTGDLTWDPYRGTLELHLKGVIKRRSFHQVRHLERFARVRTDVPSESLDREMSQALADDRAGSEGADLRDVVDKLVDAMMSLATDDEEVTSLLRAYANHDTERGDIRIATGLSSSAYHNARRRMLRLRDRLPQELREIAIDAMQ